jgi:hypothetical protein
MRSQSLLTVIWLQKMIENWIDYIY